MAATYYSESLILNHLFGKQTLTSPTTWYIGLSTGSPTEGGTLATEVSTSGTGYARVAIPNTLYSFGTTGGTGTSNGQTTNLVSIQFPQCSTDWGLITHILFYDASTGGNLWFWESLSTPIQGLIGEAITFRASSVIISNRNI